MSNQRRSNYGDNDGSRDHLAGNLANKLIMIAKEKKDLAHKNIQEAYAEVAPGYHKHIRLLSQKEKIWSKEYELTWEQKELGLSSYNGSVYVETFRPYVDVEGRITQMIDVHEKAGVGYVLDTFAEQIGPQWVMTCVFEGLNKSAQPVKTKERAAICFGGSGVDRTNPIENASTSAVGRALSHAGFGNIGSGLSSYEDMYIARNRAKELACIPECGNSTPADSNSMDSDQREENKPSVARTENQRSTSNGSTPSASISSNSSDNGQPQDDYKSRSKAVGRLIHLSRDLDKNLLKNKVSSWLRITFNGRWDSLDIGQLRTVEEHLTAMLRKQGQAS